MIRPGKFTSLYAVIALVAVILISVGCKDLQRPAQLVPSSSNSTRKVTPEDIGLYKAFLDPIGVDPNPPVMSLTNTTTPIKFVNTTVSSEEIGSLSRFRTYNKQLHQDAPYDDKFNLLREALLERNKASVAIPRIKSKFPVTFGIDEHGPLVKDCNIHFSLPVYDIEHSVALVYFYSNYRGIRNQGDICILRKNGLSWTIAAVNRILAGAESDG